MTSDLTHLRNSLEKSKGERDLLLSQITDMTDELETVQQQKRFTIRARSILQLVAQATQQEIEIHVESLVSLAMKTVFREDAYNFCIDFELRRGKTEANLFFERGGHKFHPLSSSGLGAVDIAAFALRLCLWCLMVRKSAPVFILDEPFKHLKGKRANQLAIQMLHELSQKLGLQIIIVSDERAVREDIIAGADRVFLVKKVNGIAKVEILK